MAVPINPNTIELLKKIPYFEAFSDNDLEAVAQEIRPTRCETGQIMFTKGDAGAGLHLVVSGMCKIYSLSADGREQILYHLGIGDYCNEVSAADGGPNPASLAALERSEIWVLTPAAMGRLRQKFPQLNDVIISNLAHHARQLSGRIFQLTFLSVKQRLALFLVNQMDGNQQIDRQRWTQDEIASTIGTVRDVVNRTLKSMVDAGLIHLKRGTITVVDPAGLRQLTR